jgi:hypothetical protein
LKLENQTVPGYLSIIRNHLATRGHEKTEINRFSPSVESQPDTSNEVTTEDLSREEPGEVTRKTPSEPAAYTLITDGADLPAVVQAIQESPLVGLDTETTGLNPRTDRVRLLQLAVVTDSGAVTTFLIDCFVVDPRPLFPALSSVPVVCHNAAFDLGFLIDLIRIKLFVTFSVTADAWQPGGCAVHRPSP